MKTVLFFMSGYSWAEQHGRDAVLRFARTAGWRVLCIPYAQAEASRFQLANCTVARDVRGLLEFWCPAGCIAECGAAPHHLQPYDFGDVPVVFLDRDPSTVEGDAPCVCSDAHAIAKAAFDELYATGIRNFAFAGWYEALTWSVNREAAFAKVASSAGFGMHVIEMRSPRRHADVEADRLLKAVRSLPKPLAVFAANDLIAEQIVNVCCANGISVPQDLAVVGVDNSPDICENALVSISSIPQDYEGSARRACECLAGIIAGGRKPGNVTHGVGAVVRRASTRRIGSDARVLGAFEFIRQNAAFGVKVEDVVKAMGCSRRTADLLFSRYVGHSILKELTAVRVNRAKELLRSSDAAVAAVSDMCGFMSVNDFDRVFKSQTGLSPTVWRAGGR